VGIISPQKTCDNSRFLDEPVEFDTSRLKCQEPNYKDYVAGDMVRRMSRMIKMGIASSKICLADAGCTMPDAIITGTGLGCIEDTEKFLATMIRNKEEFLTPTSFIQSTHNTVSAQIALLLKCHSYNFTYVHRGISFESALLDSMVRIRAGESQTVLLGGLDELTTNSFTIMNRLGHWKRKPVSNLKLFGDRSRGTIAGEGSAFFLLASGPGQHPYARIKGMDTFNFPESNEATRIRIRKFLSSMDVSPGDVDLVILGKNGDPAFDAAYDETQTELFPGKAAAFFKHLSGEYHTAGSFALWLSAMILKNQVVPPVVSMNDIQPGRLNNILVYNNYRNINHSLFLVSKP
jgi:3-oxoacyl-[acyl-carrier-protein] synthase II